MKGIQYSLDMKKDLNNCHKQIFKDLYESVNGLYAFTFYSRYKMPPSLIFKFIEKYKQEDVLIFENGRISLTAKGKEMASRFVNNNKNTLKNKYSNIPAEFIDIKLKINSLYLPDI
ncbi:putative uncharacterized protein [Prevotella sp. CAG:1185]|nr:putative uncharacterized protein [Prevotella sp. CAG:1185]